MKLLLTPDAHDRILHVRNETWGLDWRLQFPETVTSAEGEFLSWPPLQSVQWEPFASGGWGYRWRPSADYAEAIRAMGFCDSAGNPQHDQFVHDLVLEAKAWPENELLCLSLTLSNEGKEPVHDLACDGGCWQARNPEFAGSQEVERSALRIDGEMVSLAEIPRTVPERCMYHANHTRYNPAHAWFWGKSPAVIDQPAMIGMQSISGNKAFVFVYERADSALANSDDHHCLHSRPAFGLLNPGESKTRMGWVAFGETLEPLAEQLGKILESRANVQ